MLLPRTYAPSGELAPYIHRYYIFQASLPDDFLLIDKLLSETAFIRVLRRGNWAAQIAPDQWRDFGPIPLMGPNAVPWRVRVKGPFFVVGVGLRPSGWAGLFDEPASALADTAVPLTDLWGDLAAKLSARVARAVNDNAICTAMEEALRTRLCLRGWPAPSVQMATFEALVQHDSTIRVADAARQLGLSIRQFERQCHATFGHSPKVILRRCRFLDMAQAMRGFGRSSDEQLAALRYFDQSHLNREFRHFFEMTPGAFDKTETLLFTAGLKMRADGLI